VIGHDGKATNVTMVPGDLVLYESHSILHGVSHAGSGLFDCTHSGSISHLSNPVTAIETFPIEGKIYGQHFHTF
jgi:hypothetical protein